MGTRRPQPPQLPGGPIGGQLYVVVEGLLRRLRFTRLAERHDSTLVLSIFSFINGCLSIAIMAAVALITGQPFVFPSLGPTAFLFYYTPLAPAASPRNALYGHAIGVLAGYGSLAVFGLRHAGPALATGVSDSRIGAVALSLGLTSGLMVLLKTPHPPAGATTMIVSLGILRAPGQLLVLLVAVVLLTVQALVINRLAGLPYPLWTPTDATPPAARAGAARK